MDTNIKLFFKEGDEVAHKENITLKIEVRKIIVNTKQIDLDGQKIKRKHIVGIQCGWWDGDDYRKEIFHSNSIIPWDIAEKGYNCVLAYIAEKNKLKAN